MPDEELGGRNSSITLFGAVLLELMAKRGLRRWTDLSAELARVGYEFKPPRISNWAYGRHAVDKDFGKAVSDALLLDDDEKTQLAMAFLFGQDVKIGTARATQPVGAG